MDNALIDYDNLFMIFLLDQEDSCVFCLFLKLS